MNNKEIIGLRRRPQLIAVGICIVSLVSLFLPLASVGGKTVSGIAAASSLGGLHLIAAILVVLTSTMGLFLLAKPSVKGARLWAACGAVETVSVAILLFASKKIFDSSDLLPGSFLVKDFGIGYWLLLITAFVGLYYAMAATKLSVGYIVLALMTVIWLFPILWIVLTSFRGESGYYVGYFIPRTFTLDNYKNLFTEGGPLPFARWWLNTFFVASISCVLNTLIVLITSFVLSRQRFQGRTLLMKAMMVIGMFPGFMSMIAVYNILKGMGMSQSLGALILVNVASSAMGYYICKGFMDTVPKAMDEAARIDGATNFTIFYKVMLPMAKPIVIYQLMGAFMGPWGDYIFPSLLLGDKQSSYTVAIGLKWLTDQQRIETYYTQFAAGAVLVSVPIVILFVMLQRYYVEGMSGAVKG
jgi:arabinogalactan oligomer/maltooligosaccharide transport system permease protein